jgi:hypothetical protein
MDYECERGAKRNTEPWRMNGGGKQESDEERLDRLEREEEEKNAMQELETKTLDAKREMAVADALDEIRTRNARNERMGKDGLEVTVARESIDEEKRRQEQEDEEAARRAFMRRHEAMEEIIEDVDDDAGEGTAFHKGTSTRNASSAGAGTHIQTSSQEEERLRRSIGNQEETTPGLIAQRAVILLVDDSINT